MITKVYGPPGTGKTTKLLEIVKHYIDIDTPLDKIGYFAFTRKAANEAKERMNKPKKDLQYFQTLHSLAFNRLGMKKSEVMQDEHYEDIGRKLGIEVTVYSNGQETTGFVDSNSEYFNLINAARIKEVSIEDEYNTGMYSYELEKNLLYVLEEELNNYKDSFKLYDFTDMIEKFNVAKLCPKYDVVFVSSAYFNRGKLGENKLFQPMIECCKKITLVISYLKTQISKESMFSLTDLRDLFLLISYLLLRLF